MDDERNLSENNEGSTPIGEKIRRIRTALKITQTEVADYCNISQSAYAKIESGETGNISIRVGKRLSEKLIISFNELFDIPLTFSSEVKEELENYKKQVENLWQDIYYLNEKIAEKDEIIKILIANKKSSRDFLVMQFIGTYSNYISFIDDLISDPRKENLIEILQKKRENLIKFEKSFQQKYIDIGLFTIEDVNNYIAEMKEMGIHFKNINEM